MQTIRTGLGAVEYVYTPPVVGLTTEGWEMTLGSDAGPSAWQTPGVADAGGGKVILSLLVGPGQALNPDTGVYRVWYRRTATPETIVETPNLVFVRADAGEPLPPGVEYLTTAAASSTYAPIAEPVGAAAQTTANAAVGIAIVLGA